MLPSDTESREGLYEVFYREGGERLIVLEGLRADDTYSPPPLQEWIHPYYGVFEFCYWILLGSTLIYMAGIHIVIPLLRRFGMY